MKVKFLSSILIAIVFLGCGEPTEVVIVRGERIGAPSNVYISGLEPYNEFIYIDFVPSSNALSHKIYASHSNNKRPFYEVTPETGTSAGTTSFSFNVSKNKFQPGAFNNYGGVGGVGYWPLGGLRYIGVASFSYANVYSDIKWIAVSSGSSSNPGGNPGDYSGGSSVFEGTWRFTGQNIQGQGILTVTGTGWMMYDGSGTVRGTFTITGSNSATLYDDSGLNIGIATLTGNNNITVVLNSNSSYAGTYYGTR